MKIKAIQYSINSWRLICVNPDIESSVKIRNYFNINEEDWIQLLRKYNVNFFFTGMSFVKGREIMFYSKEHAQLAMELLESLIILAKLSV